MLPARLVPEFMSIYQKNLRRLGIILIVISVLDAVMELVFYGYFKDTATLFRRVLMTRSGILMKDGLGAMIGFLALYLYQRKTDFREIVRFMNFLVLVELLTIFLTIQGKMVNRVDGMINATLILSALVMYTALQVERGELNWKKICKDEPTLLDLKIQNARQWFDPVQIGPKLELSAQIAQVVDRYLKTAKKQQPLEINIRCPHEISEPMQDTMRETFHMYYEDEARKVDNYLEGRYSRVMALVIISIIAVTVWIYLASSEDESVIWTILSNFAAFSLWQIGYTYYERSEGYNELRRAQIAQMAKLSFWTD